MYSTSKAWPLLKLQKFSMLQQLTPSIEEKFNITDNGRQQTITSGLTQIGSISPMYLERMTPGPTQIDSISPMHQEKMTPEPVQMGSILQIRQKTITPHPANALGSTTLIRQPTITPGPAQIGSVPPMRQEINTPYPANVFSSTSPIHQPIITPGPAQIGSTLPEDLPQQFFDAYANPYTQIPEVSQGIGSCLAAIIQDNDNDNIRFYLQDLTQAYVEIASDLNPDFYIRPLSKLISQLSTLFDSIVKVMKLLYGKPEADNHRFAIYHPHYKEKPGMTESAHNYHLVPHLTVVIGEISQQPSFSLTMVVSALLSQA